MKSSWPKNLVKYLIIMFLLSCGQSNAFCQEPENITISNLQVHMDSIASDATEGRYSGSAGYMMAANYAVNIFHQAGLKPLCINEKGEKSYFQTVSINNCNNIIAIVPGTAGALQKEYIAVSAHLDHIGKQGNKIFNGANDDASGCVIILEVAKAIAMHPLKRSVMFILFTGEEQGLIGSDYFVNNLPVPKGNINVNINIEQVGSMHRSFQGIWAIGYPEFEQDFYNANTIFENDELKYDSINSMVDIIKSCDTYSFYSKSIPSVILGSGGFPEHHKVEDKIDLIDFNHLQKSANLLLSFIVEIGDKEYK